MGATWAQPPVILLVPVGGLRDYPLCLPLNAPGDAISPVAGGLGIFNGLLVARCSAEDSLQLTSAKAIPLGRFRTTLLVLNDLLSSKCNGMMLPIVVKCPGQLLARQR